MHSVCKRYVLQGQTWRKSFTLHVCLLVFKTGQIPKVRLCWNMAIKPFSASSCFHLFVQQWYSLKNCQVNYCSFCWWNIAIWHTKKSSALCPSLNKEWAVSYSLWKLFPTAFKFLWLPASSIARSRDRAKARGSWEGCQQLPPLGCSGSFMLSWAQIQGLKVTR